VGTIDLAIPRVRDGSYFPSLLDPRRLSRAGPPRGGPGIASLSKSEVSRICASLDAEVEAFRHRSLAGERYPYCWLDATVRHEAPHDRVGWKGPPLACRSRPVKLGAA
jgi:putative transposase